MHSSSGYTLAELILSLMLLSVSLLSIITVWLSTQQANSSLSQLQIATQFMHNIQQQLLVNNNHWDSIEYEQWRTEVQKILPNATLIIDTNEVQLNWFCVLQQKFNCDPPINMSCIRIVF